MAKVDFGKAVKAAETVFAWVTAIGSIFAGGAAIWHLSHGEHEEWVSDGGDNVAQLETWAATPIPEQNVPEEFVEETAEET